MGVEFVGCEDITLLTKAQAMADRHDGQFWQKYTQFYNNVKKFDIR